MDRGRDRAAGDAFSGPGGMARIRTEAERALQIRSVARASALQVHHRGGRGPLARRQRLRGLHLVARRAISEHMAQEIFYSLEGAAGGDRRGRSRPCLASGSTNTEALARTKSRRRNLEERYDRFLTETGFFNRGMARRREASSYRVARIFGFDIRAGHAVQGCFYRGRRCGPRRIETMAMRPESLPNRPSTPARRPRLSPTGRRLRCSPEDLPPQFFYLAMMESDFNTYAVGPRLQSFGRAKGAWQFTPSTATEFWLEARTAVRRRGLPRSCGRAPLTFAKATTAAAKSPEHSSSRPTRTPRGLLVTAVRTIWARDVQR